MNDTKKNNKALSWLALTEGVSFLLLLFITMPLKYYMGYPTPNMIVGMAHGALFVFYVMAVLYYGIDEKWKIGKVFLALIASIVPFGTFWADKKLFR